MPKIQITWDITLYQLLVTKFLEQRSASIVSVKQTKQTLHCLTLQMEALHSTTSVSIYHMTWQ
jgi:hypothetical protein